MKVLGIIRYEHTVTEFPRYSKTMGQENFGREVAIMGIHFFTGELVTWHIDLLKTSTIDLTLMQS
ncbi:MAG TPA: hypothetical protein PKN37_07055 [Mesotoga sp.]|mgnify:CR=1 FL=1|nr:hypothetical protein [Mesotoga sp.]